MTNYDTTYDPLQAFIDLFADVDSVAEAKVSKADLTLEERLRTHIIDGEKEGLHDCLDEAMNTYAPLEIVNDHLLDGMKTVGELFGSGQMQLPFVLQSAEVMKKAVAHLEPHMEKVEGQTKGSIVLATVKGDVHDIGKNLVDIILTNNGYTVHNIGIKQPISDILKAFEDTKADAIGLSGLLVKSVNVMEENIKEMNAKGVLPPLIIGGAALARSYAEGYLRSQYEGPLLYGKDAFDGLRIMDHLTGGKLSTLQQEIDDRQSKRTAAETEVGAKRAKQAEKELEFERTKGVATQERVHSEVARTVEVPIAPFFGSRIVEDIDLGAIFSHINPVALYSVQWQIKRGTKSKEDHARDIEDKAKPVFERLKQQCKDEHILQPKLVYGYYPVASAGNDLIVYDPDDHDREIERFTFPRQAANRRLCIADFFKDEDECREIGRKDVLGMSCVTMGQRVSEVCKTLFEADDYTEYLYMHGMGVESAEGLAELWHKRMRQELGIGGGDSPRINDLFKQKYRGSRYSFGYPACPDMSDQDKLWKLI
ncbi:MAG: vitamin B12 dependent-methionine synthase activation domain-containing protein, partial [Planctomycetota bacterium]